MKNVDLRLNGDEKWNSAALQDVEALVIPPSMNTNSLLGTAPLPLTLIRKGTTEQSLRKWFAQVQHCYTKEKNKKTKRPRVADNKSCKGAKCSVASLATDLAFIGQFIRNSPPWKANMQEKKENEIVQVLHKMKDVTSQR